MKPDLTLTSSSGGTLSILSDSNPEAPDYIQWRSQSGYLFGIVPNSPQLRAFLRRALARLEQDATPSTTPSTGRKTRSTHGRQSKGG